MTFGKHFVLGMMTAEACLPDEGRYAAYVYWEK